MPPRPERHWARLAASYAAFVGLLVLIAIPIYVAIDSGMRPAVARLACAAFVGVAFVHLIRSIRRPLDDSPPSPLDRPPGVAPEPTLDPLLAKLCDEVRLSALSRRYFDAILWPRLGAFATRRRGADAALEPPPRRPWLRRLGPTPATLAGLITAIERRA